MCPGGSNRRVLRVSLSGFVLLAVVVADGRAQGVRVERDVPVPMRDGVVLRADVYRPDGGGPYPVLVLRTP